jgi:hypothetical protein
MAVILRGQPLGNVKTVVGFLMQGSETARRIAASTHIDRHKGQTIAGEKCGALVKTISCVRCQRKYAGRRALLALGQIHGGV